MYQPEKHGEETGVKESFYESTRWIWRSPWIAGQLCIWGTVMGTSLLAAIIMRYSSLPASALPPVAYTINAVALFAGGFATAKRMGKKGWLYGGLQGILYVLILLLISFLAFDALTAVHPLLFALFAFGASALGGMAGVNAAK
jgi:putative membrane protein (TIGR04086 family)